eukprot:4217998-Amphidinium_carterae.1
MEDYCRSASKKRVNALGGTVSQEWLFEPICSSRLLDTTLEISCSEQWLNLRKQAANTSCVDNDLFAKQMAINIGTTNTALRIQKTL